VGKITLEMERISSITFNEELQYSYCFGDDTVTQTADESLWLHRDVYQLSLAWNQSDSNLILGYKDVALCKNTLW
jgi:hypothetical protein